MPVDARSLQGRRGVVSGAAGGIGRAVALRLAHDGASVFVFDNRGDEVKKVADDIDPLGVTSGWAQSDVTDEEDVHEAFRLARSQFGAIDFFVGSAGIIEYGSTHELDLATWQRVIDINLTGMFLSCKYALQGLVEHGGGSIVAVASVAAMVERPGPRSASYAASKAGVVALTRSIAVNYADQGIRANCVCPGAVATELNANSGYPMPPPMPSAAPTRAPMQRSASPNEVTGAISFLVSDDASFVTGSVLIVDGGLTAM